MNEIELTTPSKDYLNGFNLGYELSREKPELALSLLDKLPQSEKSDGFKDGWKQTVLEKSMENKPKHLSKEVQPAEKNKDITKDHDKE